MHRNLLQIRNLAALLVAILLASAFASAESSKETNAAKIRIKNFGRASENYFRGAQPEDRDFPDLAALGVKTVIDLTKDGRKDEQYLVQLAGMKFFRIPLTTSEAPPAAAVNKFLSIVNDPANWPVFVHCQGGRHRTGVMTAVYRMTKDGWNADRAYQEMKQFRFEGFPGHPELKRFVYDYYSALGPVRQAETAERRTAVGISK
jgi:protein tyrosine/serine phosphatase